MNAPAAKMLVMTEGDCACIRIIGRANFTSGVDFKTLTVGLCDGGCKRFVLDLSECVLMDSTFLGLLAGLGVRLNGGDGWRGVELFNPGARIIELLETLGVLQLFEIRHGGSPAADGVAQPVPTAGAASSHAEVTRTCLEAHQTLMELSPGNAARFKDVTQFLAEGLKKDQAE
jgi:anti-sigma B factor antagonist